MESYGVAIGGVLLPLVTIVAIAIGAKANRSVQQFREEEHESFTGQSLPSPRIGRGAGGEGSRE